MRIGRAQPSRSAPSGGFEIAGRASPAPSTAESGQGRALGAWKLVDAQAIRTSPALQPRVGTCRTRSKLPRLPLVECDTEESDHSRNCAVRSRPQWRDRCAVRSSRTSNANCAVRSRSQWRDRCAVRSSRTSNAQQRGRCTDAQGPWPGGDHEGGARLRGQRARARRHSPTQIGRGEGGVARA